MIILNKTNIYLFIIIMKQLLINKFILVFIYIL